MEDLKRLSETMEALRPHLLRMPSIQVGDVRKHVVFLSFTDGTCRASVRTLVSAEAHELERRIADELGGLADMPRWLRLDWVDAQEQSTWQAVRHQLKRVKRNYFRLGIALDPGFERAFLEVELNANAMLYGGPGHPSAVLNEKNFALYAARRHGRLPLSFADAQPVWLFTTGGVFLDDSGHIHPLADGGLDAGRRKVKRLTAGTVEQIVQAGSDYLATQVQDNGQFHYGWHPCFDRPIAAYNSLRHASTLYSMLEAWEVNRARPLEAAIARALDRLTRTMVGWARLPCGKEAAFLIDSGGEIKLGGNAVAILALAKHIELTGDRQHLVLAQALAAGIVHMQDPLQGSFNHVLSWPELEVKQAFRIIYYDGEAAFALMRLHALTGEAHLLDAVERAFAYFIEAGHEKAHDHWLGYCVNELTRHRPEARYYRFALDNVRDHLDFVEERITTFPTLLELMMAAHETITRLANDPVHAHLLDDFDIARFERAMHRRAHYLLNGHFWPELAMFHAKPERIVGSFFIRHHAFRVRIDDVEHYLSGLIAYRRHLREQERDAAVSKAPAIGSAPWTAREVVRATGGHWHRAPAPQWTAQGLCIAPATMQLGDIVAVRLTSPGVGVSPAGIGRLSFEPAALITSDATAVDDFNLPTLVVPDVSAAVLAMGHDARTRMTGHLVGVTGSAGKTTTVAMLARVLGAFGKVAHTRHNANLPAGVAWNLASAPRDATCTVMELAIGRMARTTRMTRPDIAIFTNILPAHLEFHKDLETVARRKSVIFEGMRPGGIAILNRDMEQWERIHMAARARGLQVVHYGTSRECDFRLLNYDASTGEVHARLEEREVLYRLGAEGQHMALNSLAVLAAVHALGKEFVPAIERLAQFKPEPGRGNEFEVNLSGGRRVRVIDDAYNANPGSVAAALASLAARQAPGRRIAVLGEMLELGPDAAAFHDSLVLPTQPHGIDKVHVLGALYEGFWDALPDAQKGSFAHTLDEIKAILATDLQDGDTLLLKGSHGTGLFRLPQWIATKAATFSTVEEDHGLAV